MNTAETIITSQNKKLYDLISLSELCPIYKELSNFETKYNELEAKEKSGELYQNEDELNTYIALQEQKEKLEEKCREWWNNAIIGLNQTPEDFQKFINDMKGPDKKKRSAAEPSAPTDMMSKIREWGSFAVSNMWNYNNQRCIGNTLINQISDYICSSDKNKIPLIDNLVIETIDNINKNIPRQKDYAAPSSLLLKAVEDKIKKSAGYDDIREKYFASMMLEKANTTGPDNHMMRCLASGSFYLPEYENQYSEYFIKNYGEKFNLNPRAIRPRKKNLPQDKFNVKHLLDMVAQTYDKETSDNLKNYLKRRGIHEADFPFLNSYDVARVLQKGSAAANGSKRATNLEDIMEFCPDSPYKRQSRRLGFMLAMGKDLSAAVKKGDDLNKVISDYAKRMDMKILQVGKNQRASFSTVWKECFADQYENPKVFLADSLNAFRRISSDFEKQGCKEYYEKWVDALCQEGKHNPRFEGIKNPDEITIHHKIPVKIARSMAHPEQINDTSNFLLCIEFNMPTNGKLTKHLQEHAKENGSLATISTEPDSRYYISSGNTTLGYSVVKDPESFEILRNQQKDKNLQLIVPEQKSIA